MLSRVMTPAQAKSVQTQSQNVNSGMTITHMLWSVLSGASFYGLSYFFFVRGGTQFSATLFVSLLLVGAIIGVLTLWGSSWLKSRFLRGENADTKSILGSITMGRVTFLFFVPIVLLIGMLHFGLGLYFIGMALAVQKLVEAVSLAMAREVPFTQSLVASLMTSVFWFMPLLFLF